MAISINQHVSRGELEISIHKLWEKLEDQTYTLILKGDGAEIRIYINKEQLEEIAGKTMAYLMPELASQ
jgi:hypothetical protein